jgi:hypothetical protein
MQETTSIGGKHICILLAGEADGPVCNLRVNAYHNVDSLRKADIVLTPYSRALPALLFFCYHRADPNSDELSAAPLGIVSAPPLLQRIVRSIAIPLITALVQSPSTSDLP